MNSVYKMYTKKQVTWNMRINCVIFLWICILIKNQFMDHLYLCNELYFIYMIFDEYNLFRTINKY